MDLTDKKTIKELLKNFDLWAKRGLGQNFLIDKTVIAELTSNVSKEDTIIEVGPGLGVLTKELCQKAKKIIAVEKDKQMIEVLKLTCKDFANLEVINSDVLAVNMGRYVKDRKYKVVANLPFYISSPIFRFFLENEARPKEMNLIVQKEIAERVTAQDNDLNILAISVRLYADSEILKNIKNTSFWPAPRVDAAILKINTLEKPRFEVDTKEFFRVVKTGFGERRKKLVNSLSGGLGIPKGKIEKILKDLGINENIRAEKLSMNDWRQVYLRLKV